MGERQSTRAEREKAREMYAEEGYIEVDPNAAASRADDAVWVQAWVRVPYEELPGGADCAED